MLSEPLTCHEPSAAGKWPRRVASRVDLPEPDGPMIQVVVPGATVRLTLRRTSMSPYAMVRFFSSRLEPWKVSMSAVVFVLVLVIMCCSRW